MPAEVLVSALAEEAIEYPFIPRFQPIRLTMGVSGKLRHLPKHFLRGILAIERNRP